MAGWRVLTRPPRHSGNPVTASTAVTGTPAAAMAAAVLPVDTISIPASCSKRASRSRPVLSYTLMIALAMTTLLTAATPPIVRSLPCAR